jgi:hypothetical protein
MRLDKPGGPGSHIYIPQEQGGTVILPSIGCPLRHLLRLAGLRWSYSNPPLTWSARSPYINPSGTRLSDGQSVSMSWYRARLWDLRPDTIFCRNVAV